MSGTSARRLCKETINDTMKTRTSLLPFSIVGVKMSITADELIDAMFP